MFTDIKVVLSQDLSKRGYITFYIEGERYREYNGKKLGIEMNPNLYKTFKDRQKQFKLLAYEYQKAIENGWKPLSLHNKREASLKKVLHDILEEKVNSSLSSVYKRDLTTMYNNILSFLPAEVLNKDISTINDLNLDTFLNQFKSSSTYYMNKRKVANVFFSELLRKKLIKENPIAQTKTLKKVAKLHKTYNEKQLKAVLDFLKVHYPNLHLCCLLAYGCFLRPHQEIRLLKKQHISDDLTKVTLSGAENKSRRVRVANVPKYVQVELRERLSTITEPETNVLSLSDLVYNESYLNTQWSRAKKKLVEKGIIEKEHTIYSFRHTASVNVYRKTKDLHILQQLLQHSNMIVTLTYLRGLGELNNDSLISSLPEL